MVEQDSPKGQIDNKYQIGRFLGAGATAKVYKAVNTNGTEFAIKVFDKETEDWSDLK